MPSPQRKAWISPADHLAAERVADVRSEYVDGERFAVQGESRRHADIAGRLGSEIRRAALALGGDAYFNRALVRVEPANCYYYPDIVVTCDPADDDPYVVHAPLLVVEVLSERTEATDRREKRMNYRKIPSLRELVLVSQTERRVEIYRRESGGWGGRRWSPRGASRWPRWALICPSRQFTRTEEHRTWARRSSMCLSR